MYTYMPQNKSHVSDKHTQTHTGGAPCHRQSATGHAGMHAHRHAGYSARYCDSTREGSMMH